LAHFSALGEKICLLKSHISAWDGSDGITCSYFGSFSALGKEICLLKSHFAALLVD
jgi:hypothetical protein